LDAFGEIEDPQAPNARYPLMEVLLIALAAIDGKTLQRALERGQKSTSPHLVNVWAVPRRV
jgi:hypothetical protein